MKQEMERHQPVCPHLLPHLLVPLAGLEAHDPPGPVTWQGTGLAPVLLLPLPSLGQPRGSRGEMKTPIPLMPQGISAKEI